jgi:NAD(P)-dependent dehydrogenase (short-subunit alcohol dehydrogenase family)
MSAHAPESANGRLAGRTALITGASRGIGAATARALAALGARLILTARGTAALESLAREIGGGAIVRPCDLTNADQVSAWAEHVRHDCAEHASAERIDVERVGAPDIIVNNAGVFRLALLAEMPDALFLQTMQANLVAPFLVLRAFLPAMRARGSGDVVTIGSIADRMIMAENGAYSAAKYGLRAMHEVLRMELRGSGVRATLVSPGATDTPLWDPVLAESHARNLPTRDVMLSADAVADAIAYVVTRPAGVNIDELRLSHS